MVWCVCSDHVKHSRSSTPMSARVMEGKALSGRSFRILVLILVLHPVKTTTTTGFPTNTSDAGLSTPNSTTVTGRTTMHPATTTHSFTTDNLNKSTTVPGLTSPFTSPDMTATSSNISTMTYMTNNQTTATPHALTENTTFSPTTRNTISLTTANYTSTENTSQTTANFTSTEITTSQTTANFTSNVNTSTTQTTANFTSTEDTTFSENATIFTTLAPSSSAFTTNNQTTVNETLTTTGTAPKPCDFSQSCLNVFYWMTTSIVVAGKPQTEQNISTQLQELFTTKLDACAVSIPTSAYPASYPAAYSTPAMSLFEAMELTCDSKNITTAQCYILLKLSSSADVCCIENAVMESDFDFKISVVGQIERVGVCADDLTQISAGKYDKCNQTVNVEDVCGEKPQNISCGNSTNVIFPLNGQENCTVSPPTPCFCSHCNNSDFYYYMTISVKTITPVNYVSKLLESPCNNTASICNISQTFKNHIQDKEVICPNVNNNDQYSCVVIVKLYSAMDLCDISTAVESIVEPQKDSTAFDGAVSRAALCYDPSSNPLKSLSLLVKSWSPSFSSLDFCMEANKTNFSGYCSKDAVVVFLNDSCNPYRNFTTSPPSFTTTSLLNATMNATATTYVNVTANVTNTASTTPSGTSDPDALLSLSADASSLNASQVNQLLSQLENLLAGPNVSLALANTSVNIVNNLLDAPAAAIASSSKKAIGIVDTVGLKLVVSGTSQTVISQSLALGVKKVDGANFQQTSFSISDSSNLQIRRDPSVSSEVSEIRVSSTPLGSVSLPASLTQNLTAEQQQLASRVQFNFYQKSTFFQDKSLGNRTLNSGILGSSVANLSISGLQEKVLITLRNTKPIPANYTVSCVFWDFSLNGGSGGWSSSGCQVLNYSAEETQCACNHLTSFGILLDISKTPTPAIHLVILTYITYIGCGISAIFLSVTLLTYLAFGKLRKDIPSKILIQLCVALLLLNLVFLLDAWLALYPDAVGLCISTAFFLHYILLVSFTWMALEAVYMYLALVQVFNTYISRFMLKIGLAGWGIPLIIVIIVIAVNKDNYGLVTYGRYANGATDDFCWIKNDVVFYVSVVAYFCLVFLLNVAMFIVVMIQLCRLKQQNPHTVQQRNGWQELRSVAGLTVLLGLTWGFAFFAWGPVSLAFMYLFAIFNTLQGFFIFVFHCAMKENVRRQWRTYLCCGSLRVAENSEWSRTATQKINKPSNTRISSFHSSNSNNSSASFLNHDVLASETHMGIGNPVDDRTITEAERPSSGSDVVLNELNSQYRGQRSYRRN